MRNTLGALGFLSALVLASASAAHAQETTFGFRVHVDPADHRLMVQTDSACAPLVNGLRNEACSVYGRIKYYRPAQGNEKISGSASINRDAQDPSILHVNFFRFVCTTPGARTKKVDADTAKTPSRCRARADAINGRQYALVFANRQSEVFRSSGVHFRAITIPLKARFAYESDTVKVPARAEAGINGNLFMGYRFGWEKYFYERGAARNPYTRFHITPGVFGGASAVTVSKGTSRTARVPQDPDVPTAAVSGGLGVLMGFRTFNLGAFVGMDHAFGEVGEKWDYQHRPFLGIGITLDSFWEGLRL